MGRHLEFSVATGRQVYLCDPRSPWQRPTNENTNGLLRQYFPKSTDLTGVTAAHLDTVADELNGRPRKILDYMTPSEKFAELVASTA
jgi:transposase, IS30 family